MINCYLRVQDIYNSLNILRDDVVEFRDRENIIQ